MSIRIFLLLLITAVGCNTSNPDVQSSFLQLFSVEIDGTTLSATETTTDISVTSPVVASFSSALDTTSTYYSMQVLNEENTALPFQALYENNKTTVSLILQHKLAYATNYRLLVSDQLKGAKGEQFKGAEYTFQTQNGSVKLDSIKLNGNNFDVNERILNIDFDIEIIAYFSEPLNEQDLANKFRLDGTGNTDLTLTLDESKKVVTLKNTTPLTHLSLFY